MCTHISRCHVTPRPLLRSHHHTVSFLRTVNNHHVALHARPLYGLVQPQVVQPVAVQAVRSGRGAGRVGWGRLCMCKCGWELGVWVGHDWRKANVGKHTLFEGSQGCITCPSDFMCSRLQVSRQRPCREATWGLHTHPCAGEWPAPASAAASGCSCLLYSAELGWALGWVPCLPRKHPMPCHL